MSQSESPDQSAGHGPPSDHDQPAGYGHAPGYAPEYGQPTAYGHAPGYGQPAAHGQSSGYGQPPGYGSPSGSGAAHGGLPPAGSGGRMPGIAAAAAVLGFVEAGLGLVFLTYLLAITGGFGFGDDRGWFAVLALSTIGISALLLLGGLFVVRGTGRRLLLGTTIAEIVLGLGLGIWAFAESSSSFSSSADYYDDGFTATYTYAIGGAVLAAVVIALVLPVVRLSLGAQRAVGTWLQASDMNRRTAPPVWSPETGAWVAARTSSPGTVLALMAPVALAVVATVVVLATAPDEPDYGYADPYAEPGLSSPYADLYQGGDPVEPPTSDDPEYDSYSAPNATACFDGDLGACDSLYFQSDIGTVYEWLGSTCGGREEFETYGSCE